MPAATSSSDKETALTFVKGPVPGSPITHVIVVIQENRTVDNLFASSFLTGGGPYPGANVATTFSVGGGPATPLNEVPFEYPADPDHSHAALVEEAQYPQNTGFYENNATGTNGEPNPPRGFVFSYVPDFETLLYHTLASTYALGDNMFSSRLVPTFPGHLFLISGQSAPADDPTDPVNWGCDSQPGTTVGVFSGSTGESETLPGVFPCFDNLTIGDLMNEHRVSWRYYTGQIDDTIDAGFNVYDAIRHIRYGGNWNYNVVWPETRILTDIADCNLSNVSYVTPPGLSSDHAGSLSSSGPGWVGTLYLAIAESNAIQKSPACQYYGNTAIIVTWDDSGGWYDHVTPPQVAGRSWGFRVPLIVASAWASHGTPGSLPFVSHTQRDFGSILKFIETNWGLGTLGGEDVGADNLADMFNYSQTPVPPITAAKMRRLVQATHFDVIRAQNDRTPPDDQ